MTFGPAIHVGCYHDMDHLHKHYRRPSTPLMDTIFPDDCGTFYHNNAPSYKTKRGQEWFEGLFWPPKPPYLCPDDHLWDVGGKQAYLGRLHFSNFKTSCQHFGVGYCSTSLVEFKPWQLGAILAAKVRTPLNIRQVMMILCLICVQHWSHYRLDICVVFKPSQNHFNTSFFCLINNFF